MKNNYKVNKKLIITTHYSLHTTTQNDFTLIIQKLFQY